MTNAQFEGRINLFPNPAVDLVEIQAKTEQPIQLELVLYDLQGSIVRSFGKYDFTKKSMRETLSIADILPGVYMFLATDYAGIRFIQKRLIIR